MTRSSESLEYPSPLSDGGRAEPRTLSTLRAAAAPSFVQLCTAGGKPGESQSLVRATQKREKAAASYCSSFVNIWCDRTKLS